MGLLTSWWGRKKRHQEGTGLSCNHKAPSTSDSPSLAKPASKGSRASPDSAICWSRCSSTSREVVRIQLEGQGSRSCAF